jgi:hypothetical protein
MRHGPADRDVERRRIHVVITGVGGHDDPRLGTRTMRVVSPKAPGDVLTTRIGTTPERRDRAGWGSVTAWPERSLPVF